jgi:hypothetical protein
MNRNNVLLNLCCLFFFFSAKSSFIEKYRFIKKKTRLSTNVISISKKTGCLIISAHGLLLSADLLMLGTNCLGESILDLQKKLTSTPNIFYTPSYKEISVFAGIGASATTTGLLLLKKSIIFALHHLKK